MNLSRRSLVRPGWVHQLLPAVLAVVAAFVLGSMKVAPVEVPGISWTDKIGHFFAFGFVALTHMRAARFLDEESNSGTKPIIWGAISGSVFGGLLELWQALLPHRTAEWADFVADAAGACAVGLVVFGLQRGRS